MKYLGQTNEYFEVVEITKANYHVLKEKQEGVLSLIWFDDDQTQMTIDAISFNFLRNQMICLTEFHQIEIEQVGHLRLLRFNRPFYCILDHDSEVGCKGILFYGSSNLPLLKPDTKDIKILETVWKMLLIEMASQDNLQLEMLQMMLKRILILCTRFYKNQMNFEKIEVKQIDLIRDFNFLVEQHFRNKRSVDEYALLLNKSPKTLANLFKKAGNKTPSQFIQDRIMLEARRLLRYTDKSVSEIAYEIGYEDIHSFSRFFKKQESQSPTDFREMK
ncbi:AraC family transcriptional regulator [Ancylomarina sp. 16SWW S1-10-2]|uniref:helix-turn-helix domain-containing protein n=1 Tax=Ancylomarina sp. 16SWW S1-10-2 TaxID=2499681 RepID=UPI0012AE9CB7|nr:AraC family transcriptional regulator [Ancylomarina sp. 16SWW S1-10-2]MRT94842.1 AraC family transcriptional regulator [Ancylomarina sp. 16SWW S1-10-2]